MEKSKGIPKDIIRQIDITQKESPLPPPKVKIIVEGHQARIPLPRDLRIELDLQEGKEYICEMDYKPENKEIVCKLLWLK